ncbi:protein GREB1-like isoform X1 [Arapaima gigas]
MGNVTTGHLRTTRLEQMLHSSIEASLRSDTVVPSPIFTQLYLEAEQLQHTQQDRAENEESGEEESSKPSITPIPCPLNPPMDSYCRLPGFCQSGKDLRLKSIGSTIPEVPSGFVLVGATSPSLLDHIVVCAVDHTCLPDKTGQNPLLGFLGNCVGCGAKGFHNFTEFSKHINLKTGPEAKKKRHLQFYLQRDTLGQLVRGPEICWKVAETRAQTSQCLSPPLNREIEFLPSQKSSQQLNHSTSDPGTQIPPKKRPEKPPSSSSTHER